MSLLPNENCQFSAVSSESGANATSPAAMGQHRVLYILREATPESHIGDLERIAFRTSSRHPNPPRFLSVKPLPNIRDGIPVERLVKTVRYVADMRRLQYVVQRPEG